MGRLLYLRGWLCHFMFRKRAPVHECVTELGNFTGWSVIVQAPGEP